MSDFVVKNGLQLGGSVKGSVGTVTGNATLDLSTGSAFEVTPTADVTFAFSNPPAAGNAQSFSVALTGIDIGVSYDLANASYDSVSFSFAAQEGNGRGLFFKPDGTKMYITGQAGGVVVEYGLSPAWDVSTASFVQSFSVFSQITQVSGLFFKPDGTKMYVADLDGDDVSEYNLSTAWDISTASYLQNFSIAAQNTAPWDLFFKPDGTQFYFVGSSGNTVYEYSLSTAWDVSTASFVQGFSVAGQEGFATSLFFTADGSKMFISGQNSDLVHQYSLSTPWNIGSASYDSISFSITSQDIYVTSLFFKPDGTKMYIAGGETDSIFQYSTGTAAAPATITYPASVKWPSGTSPTAPADGETDLLTFYTDDGGTTYYGIQRGDNMS